MTTLVSAREDHEKMTQGIHQLFSKRNLLRILVGVIIAYALLWLGAFMTYQNAANKYKQVATRSDDVVFLIVYTEFHIKSVPEEQRKEIQSPDPLKVPQHPDHAPSAATPFVWKLLAQLHQLNNQTKALSEFSDEGILWTTDVLRDITPIQYR